MPKSEVQFEQRAMLRKVSADLDLLGNAIAPIDTSDAALIIKAATRLMNIADEIMSREIRVSY